MSCDRGCSDYYDVRCCCELNCKKKNSNAQFFRCPMRLNTIYFHIGNNYDLYKYAENDEWRYIKQYFKLNKNDLNTLRDRWHEERYYYIHNL